MRTSAMDKTLLEPVTRGVRHIGIHGPRNAGKTCYLGCLYGNRVGDSLHISFSDSDTLNYLAGVWKDIEKQQVPEATRGIPTDLRLDLDDTSIQRPWALALRDYPGALVQPVEQGATPLERQLSAGVKQWVSDAHALLIFLDSSDPSVEQMDALDLLLTALRKNSTNGYTLERPIGLVLTKWDRVSPTFTDAKTEEERARTYLQEHPVFKQIYRKLCDAGERLRVFPVSAFGSETSDHRPPPPEALHSYNLHAPLLWAAQKADEVLLDFAHAQAQERLRRKQVLPRNPMRYLSDCSAAAGVYRGLKQQYLISEGPVAARIDTELDALRGRRRRMVAALVLTPLLIAAAALAGLAHHGMGRDQQRLLELVRFRQSHEARAEAQVRADAERQYLSGWSSWLNTRSRPEVRKWLDADLQAAAEVEAFRTVREYETAMLSKHKFADAIAAHRDFIAKHRDTQEAGDAEARVLALLPLAEDYTEYESVRLAAMPRNPTALEAAYKKALEYENGPRPKKQMREPVRSYREWFESLQKDGAYYVEVASVTIPKGSDLDALWGTKPRVVIELNGERHATPWFKGNNPTMQARLGPYPFRWGQPGALRVRVEGHHTVLKNDHVEKTLEDPTFVLGQANGTIELTCEKGKTITVDLRCARAQPPELPLFRVR